MSKVVLSASNLVKRYGDKVAVAGIDLEVRPSEVVGLLGPNGAGKTTTFNMIAGSVRPSEGRIFLGDTDITPSFSAGEIIEIEAEIMQTLNEQQE